MQTRGVFLSNNTKRKINISNKLRVTRLNMRKNIFGWKDILGLHLLLMLASDRISCTALAYLAVVGCVCVCVCVEIRRNEYSGPSRRNSGFERSDARYYSIIFFEIYKLTKCHLREMNGFRKCVICQVYGNVLFSRSRFCFFLA